MHYTSFRIRNFKGIKDTTVNLSCHSNTGVFAFVGLNESGKTTILEAIHSFSPDSDTSNLVDGKAGSGVPFVKRVPRHLLSNFSGDVSVSASIQLDEADKESILDDLKDDHNIRVENDFLPDIIEIERHQRFKGGDFSKSYFTLRTPLKIVTGRQKKWRVPNSNERVILRDAFYFRTPDIAYFPTFVFDFPKRIYLTDGRGDNVNQFYRGAFQDILDFDKQGHTIEESIVRRIRSEDKKIGWLDFISIWNTSDDKDKIQHVLDRASSAVTEVVFGRWNKIFGEDVKGKEINISYDTSEGEVKDVNGRVVKTHEHDIFIKFQIRDGTRRFDVNDRSLGFRWFFSFMLFTQFRVAREETRPILFLFDEPASNLHAAAQQKLIDSFPEIAKENHTLAYTTHSHYMIEPKWLEQTFIVTNRADAPTDSVIDAMSLSDESLDIKATSYKSFVNAHPAQTDYFQPILDRLQVKPSRFDYEKSSIIVEGKSDYYILRYCLNLLGREDLPLVPGIGASTFGALVALHLGWGLDMLFLLDGDREGKKQRDRYVKEYGLPLSRAVTIDELKDGVNEIEDLLDDESLEIIKSDLQVEGKLTKKQICRFFQERLARNEVLCLGPGFKKISSEILDVLSNKLKN